MTRRQNKRQNSAQRGRGLNITRTRFHALTTSTLSSGGSSQSVGPGLNSTLTAMAAVYELYRVSKLRYRLHPNASQSTALIAAYYPEAQVTIPSIDQNSENIDCCMLFEDTTVPTPWHNVPRSRLKGQIDWWKCVPDAGASEFEIQGIIVLTGTGTDAFRLEMDGVVEFKNPIPAAAAAAVHKQRAMDEVRKDFILVPRNQSLITDDGTKPMKNK